MIVHQEDAPLNPNKNKWLFSRTLCHDTGLFLPQPCLFEIVITVAVQSVFRLEIYQNNIFFIY